MSTAQPRPAPEEYRSRIAAHADSRDALSASDARVAHARLATFGAAVLLAALAWRGSLSVWWLIAPGVAFLLLIRHHDRVLRARDGATRAIAFYERGQARIADAWAGAGEAGERFRDDHHVYANDLDLFGRGSLFELLSLARTRSGEETLAGWLKSPADAAEIRARQQAVDELAPALDLREQLALAGADLRAAVHSDRLIGWAESPLPVHRQLHAITWCLTGAVVLTIAYLVLTRVWWPLAMVLALLAVAVRRLRPQMNAIISEHDPDATADFVADALTHRALDLDVVADLLRILERQHFSTPRLVLARNSLTVDGTPASIIIRRLHRLAVLHDSERNTLIFPIALFLLGQLEVALSLGALLQLVRPHVAVAVQRWRRQHGPRVGRWLQTVAEFEGLSSLAAYRYEHPADVFPIILADEETRFCGVFDGNSLGHPLLPAASMVRNDVRLAGATRLLIVSGSNMSGKSTLLRTVGINAVLALAGAPVRAESLRLTPLRIGATLRIQDSLQEGRSRFYAEITRIRELADVAAGPVPLLFLLDELFHGTNSHDRVIGASGVLRSLLDRGAIGLVTTHDLAVTDVAAELSPRAVNVHFQDWFEGNEIRFDYLMKPGPVTRSNAIALMRAVGLDVPSRSGDSR